MRYFEVVRRDGPARMGRLMLDRVLSTPCLISPDDYVSAGSIFRYKSIDDAIEIARSFSGSKKLVVLPYPAELVLGYLRR